MRCVADLAASLDVKEEGVRLIIGQLLAYPVFLIFRYFVMHRSSSVQHAYVIATGIAIAYWSIGGETVIHTTVTILSTYAMLFFLGPSILSASFVFIFNMIYLLFGYFYYGTEGYDVTWTMPQCVLCLRLIAVSIDYYDGSKSEESLTKEQQKTNLKKLPTLMELMSQCLFIGGYFVGPQFSMRRYQDYILRNTSQKQLPSPCFFGFKRLLLGALYMTFHVVGSSYVPHDYVMTEDFAALPFWNQSFWYFVWAKVILAKYISAWLIGEGALAVSGLAYNGIDEDGHVLWNGGANVRLRRFESATRFEHIIFSFNINTNNWVATYIYKRLRFLGSKTYSQIVTLIFLSMWHGLHSGYYLTFFNEFIVMNFEKDVESIIKGNARIQHWLTHPGSSSLTWLIGKFYVSFFLPHCFMPFVLLKNSKYLPVLYQTRGLLYVFFLLWPIYSIPIKMLLKPKKKIELSTPIKQD